MTWVDIGVNLGDKSFDRDREDVIARAQAAGVEAMIVTGTSVARSTVAAELCKSKPGLLYSTAGVHPHDAKSCDDSTLDALRELASRDEVVAVGECGLDFNRNFSPPDVQVRWFEAQLELAAELSMPVFVHERDAATELHDILRRFRDRLTAVVVHCFTGDEAALHSYLDLDLHIGITGWICDERRGTHLRDLIGSIGEDRLMLETDAPYLVPRTIRPRPKSRRNEPAFITAVAEVVAESKGIATDVLATQTTATARSFFGLP